MLYLKLGQLLIVQHRVPLSPGLEQFQGTLFLAHTLKNPTRDVAVDLGAGQFFEQFCPLVGAGLQKGSKTALGQQHGLGKTAKVQPGQRTDGFQLVLDAGGDNGAVGLSQLHLGGLQFAVGFAPGPALGPEGAVSAAFHLKLHLGQGLRSVTSHQFIVAGGDGGQARGLVVEGKADGIKQCGFARPRGAGDGEQATVGERFLAKVDLPLTFEGVDVFQA